jgi:diguanylate cyclase (GGDEF)-like protein
MLYLIIMSVFPHPNVPSVYYPLFLMMAPVLFILPAYQHVVMTVLSLIVFYALVLRYKMPVCWAHELFEATTAAVFSGIVVVLMTQFRIQSDSLKSKYYALSRRDSLTGTLNKAAGEEAARECLNGMRKSDHAAMLLLDIDNFKSINDSFGHLEGDRILKLIGSTLITLCRKDDIVCRFGGDEFMILLRDVHAAGAAAEKARNILDEIARLDIDGKLPKTPALSIGICYYGDDKIDCEELIRRADAALYHAKRAGKNRFEVWSATM